jgi:hypothetical protein
MCHVRALLASPGTQRAVSRRRLHSAGHPPGRPLAARPAAPAARARGGPPRHARAAARAGRARARRPRARPAPPRSAPGERRPSSSRARAGAAEGGGAARAGHGGAQHARHARGPEADRDAHQPRAGARALGPAAAAPAMLRRSARPQRGGGALSRRRRAACLAAARPRLGVGRAAVAGAGAAAPSAAPGACFLRPCQPHHPGASVAAARRRGAAPGRAPQVRRAGRLGDHRVRGRVRAS